MRTPIRKRNRRLKKEVPDIDITSLLDILVILLVFLLKSYSSTGVPLTVTKSINLPNSKSTSPSISGLVVQVSKESIWVEDKKIVENYKKERGLYDQGRRRIIPLYNELVTKRKEIQRIEKSTPDAKKFSGIVNLVLDKTLRYNQVKRLMFTCAQAGFLRFKFVVLGENQ